MRKIEKQMIDGIKAQHPDEQLNTIDDMVCEIINLVIDMDLPLHVTRSVCSHLYAFCSDLEGAAIAQEETDNE